MTVEQRRYRLVRLSDGTEVKVGDVVSDGDKEAMLMAFTPGRTSALPGKVLIHYTDIAERIPRREFFANVIGCHVVPIED